MQKYGTREDLLKLDSAYRISEDSDIMKEYAKLVGIVGKDLDCLPIMSKINGKKYQYREDTIAEIMKSLKKLMVEEAPPKYWENMDYNTYREFEKLSTHKNPEISENAKAIMKRLSDDNPWMLE